MQTARTSSWLKLLLPFMLSMVIISVFTRSVTSTTALASDNDIKMEISSAKGGEVVSPDGLTSIYFPPRAVSENVVVKFYGGLQTPDAPSGWIKLGPSFELEVYSLATGQEISDVQDLEISFIYDPGSLTDPRLANISYWNEDIFQWSELPTDHRVNAEGKSILWVQIDRVDLFSPMASDFVASNVVVLDPDPNDGCVVFTTGGPCEYVEISRSIHTILQTKTLLEACGVSVITTFDPANIPPIPPGGHVYTETFRAGLVELGDLGVTVAYNTENTGIPWAWPGGTESYVFDRDMLSPENEAFGDNLRNAIVTEAGGPTVFPDNLWKEGSAGLSAYLDPTIRYAEVEVAFLTSIPNLLLIEYDYSLPTDDISAARNTTFAYALYLGIMNELGRTDCLCLPDTGMSIANKPRLEDLIEITDVVYTEDGIEYAYVINDSDLAEAFRQLRGEDNVTYTLDSSVILTSSVSLPFTSTVAATGVIETPDGNTVVSTSTVTETTSSIVPAPHSNGNGSEQHIFRPNEHAFFESIFRYGAGFAPWLSDEDYTLDQLNALKAGSCQGMCTLTALFCAGRLSPSVFGASSPGDVTDSGLAADYLNYYQMIQVYLLGTNQSAVEFFDLVEDRIANGQWVTEPYLLRLAYQPPDSCNTWGHVVYPYMVRTVGDTREMYVYDPNYPADNSIKVTLNSNGEWSYPFSPSFEWHGTEVNYISLAEIPTYGTSEGDLIDENTLYVQAEALEYGGWPRASYGAGTWATTSYGGWPRASYGTDDEGNLMGYEYDASGNLVCHDEIAGAAYLSFDLGDLPGMDWRPPHIMMLPKKNYTLTLGEPTDGGVRAATIYGHDAMYTFNATAESNTHDELQITSSLDVFTHTTTMDAQALSSILSRETEDWTRMFGISHTPLLSGETIIYKVNESVDTFEYINLGDDKTYHLGLVQVDEFGVGIVNRPPITIGADDRHVITPCNWDRLNTSMVFLGIDHGNNGLVDEWEILTDFPFFTYEGQHKITAFAVNGYDFWVGTQGGGLIHYRLNTNTLDTYTTSNSGLPRNQIQDVVIAPNGDVWVATDRGASRFNGSTWQTYNKNNGLPSNRVNAIATSPTGLIWVATDKGVARFNNGVWTIYTRNNGLPHNNIKALTVETNGTLWVLSVNGIVAKFNGNRWTVVRDLPHGTVDSMSAGNNTIWFAHNQGLIKYENGAFINVSASSTNLNEVSHDAVGLLCRSDMVWVVTESGDLGLYAHDNNTWPVLP